MKLKTKPSPAGVAPDGVYQPLAGHSLVTTLQRDLIELPEPSGDQSENVLDTGRMSAASRHRYRRASPGTSFVVPVATSERRQLKLATATKARPRSPDGRRP